MGLTTFNPNKYMIFYKSKGLFDTECKTEKEVKASLSWQKKGGYDESFFIVCHYDYVKEVFFNGTLEIDINDISKGAMKDRVLTKFKAEFFPSKLTEILSKAEEMKKALETISGWSKCQCKSKHGDNPNCCVLVAEQAIVEGVS